MADATSIPASRLSWRWIGKVMLALAFFILPAFYGFGRKFLELLVLLDDDSGEGAFAVTPICNYVFASVGFFFLMIWAVCNGMFHEIEKPGETMMKTEAWLDEQERLHKLLLGSDQ